MDNSNTLILIYYDGYFAPMGLKHKELIHILENTEAIIKDFFMKGVSKEDQIKLYKFFLDDCNEKIKKMKKNKEGLYQDPYELDTISCMNYWSCVMALLRFKALKEDKYNGVAGYMPEKDYKEKIKKKLQLKMRKNRG